MWRRTKAVEMLQIEYPIIQAGMAGGVTSPELVAAVSNAGGLGTLGAGYMSPGQIQQSIKEIRALTSKPFAVNLFVPSSIQNVPQKIEKMNAIMNPFKQKLGIDSESPITKYEESFEEQLAVVLEENVPVFSFTFGIPSEELLQQLKHKGITVMGTATTVREAKLLEQSGIDMIVAQGSEAGGHRGTFAGECEEAMIGTFALIPQMVDQVSVPVIAAGGIMDGRGIVAALALGASGVQMGTAFLTCIESTAHLKHKEAILTSTDESTVVTRVFSGKPARGIKNKFISEIEPYKEEIPDYPVQNALTRTMRQAASRQNKTEFMSLWSGQASALSSSIGAKQLITSAVKQTTELFNQFSNNREHR